MRILYGVVGDGQGHATRSRVVLEHLAEQGHAIKIVVSGRAPAFLGERLARHASVTLEEIDGLAPTHFGHRFADEDDPLVRPKLASKVVSRNVEVYRKVAEAEFAPELVISDFESWAALYGRRARLPVISIDNLHIIHRCKHDGGVRSSFDFRRARKAVKAKVPGAFHYLITTFFTPKVRKKYTTLVPPILRPEIIAAQRARGDHVLVAHVHGANPGLVPVLKQLPYRFRVYGAGRGGVDGNVTFCPPAEASFVEDLRTARAVISGGEFASMSDAVSVGVPLLAFPASGEFEQELGARYLAELGYGSWARDFDAPTIQRFLDALESHAERLAQRPRYDNSLFFGCLDELLQRVTRGEERPAVLESPALAKWVPK